MKSTTKLKRTIACLALLTLLASAAGCQNKTHYIGGTWFSEVCVSGNAEINGTLMPFEGTFHNVYLIDEDTVAEMLKQ